jgi:hypothetical protein
MKLRVQGSIETWRNGVRLPLRTRGRRILYVVLAVTPNRPLSMDYVGGLRRGWGSIRSGNTRIIRRSAGYLLCGKPSRCGADLRRARHAEARPGAENAPTLARPHGDRYAEACGLHQKARATEYVAAQYRLHNSGQRQASPEHPFGHVTAPPMEPLLRLSGSKE